METPNAFYCGHCGAPMTDRDVFCKSCQSITPRVQECLDRHLYMSPEKFRGRYGDNKLICPHCESENEYSNGLPLGSPILCCSECHEYFLVPDYVEWSVAKPAQKVKAFFNNWISFVFIYLFFNGVFFFSWGSFAATACFLVLFSLIWHFTFRKKKLDASRQRLKHNPDYLQILSEMGYYYKIDKKLRSKIRGYGPEAELLYCEYCDGVNPVDGGFCVNCMAPLPPENQKRRYWNTEDLSLLTELCTPSFIMAVVGTCLLLLFIMIRMNS